MKKTSRRVKVNPFYLALACKPCWHQVTMRSHRAHSEVLVSVEAKQENNRKIQCRFNKSGANLLTAYELFRAVSWSVCCEEQGLLYGLNVVIFRPEFL